VKITMMINGRKLKRDSKEFLLNVAIDKDNVPLCRKVTFSEKEEIFY
jgi:hypothetical protein